MHVPKSAGPQVSTTDKRFIGAHGRSMTHYDRMQNQKGLKLDKPPRVSVHSRLEDTDGVHKLTGVIAVFGVSEKVSGSSEVLKQVVQAVFGDFGQSY